MFLDISTIGSVKVFHFNLKFCWVSPIQKDPRTSVGLTHTIKTRMKLCQFGVLLKNREKLSYEKRKTEKK